MALPLVSAPSLSHCHQKVYKYPQVSARFFVDQPQGARGVCVCVCVLLCVFVCTHEHSPSRASTYCTLRLCFCCLSVRPFTFEVLLACPETQPFLYPREYSPRPDLMHI